MLIRNFVNPKTKRITTDWNQGKNYFSGKENKTKYLGISNNGERRLR